MLKKSNKIVALLLVVILLCGTSISVYAACNHNWVMYTKWDISYSYIDSTYCNEFKACDEICTLCTDTRFITMNTPIKHTLTTISAICNGKIQTLTKRCAKCKDDKTKKIVKQACPGATHTGTCPYLPV